MSRKNDGLTLCFAIIKFSNSHYKLIIATDWESNSDVDLFIRGIRVLVAGISVIIAS